MRLQRYLSLAGVASRRRAEELIVRGTVRVNGRQVKTLGTTVGEGDHVEVDGRTVTVAVEREMLVLNKPVGVMTTMRDPEGRRTVADLMHAARGRKAARLVPVGRLDYDTSGVLLLTNDGDAAHALTHPRFGVEKLYRATLKGRLLPADVQHLLAGVRMPGLEDAPRAEPARVKVVAAAAGRSVVDITLHEGRNRQVRRMFEAVGHPLVALERLRFGPVSLGQLRVGEMREVTPRERKTLDAIVRESRGEAAQADDEDASER